MFLPPSELAIAKAFVSGAHYDMGSAFYALWLDRARVYSCAYFEPGTDDLDLPQQAMLELVCRPLRLRPGDRLLDIGCGWGALVRGFLGLAQVVFTRPDDAGCTAVPVTREALHARPLVGAVAWSAAPCE